MPIDPSMEPMLDTFIYETTTLLDQLDQILLDSEKSKSFSSDSVNEVFRIMHTIKGSAAMMDLDGISTLAHAVEDVFFILREDPSRLALGGEALFDVVFQASDFLKSEVDSVQNTGDATQDPSAMIQELERLSALMQGKSAPAAQPEPVAAQPAAQASVENPGLHQVRVYFEEGCQMENIRAFMLMEQLRDQCDSLESVPAHPESDSSLCSELSKNGFLILFHPIGSVEEVLQTIENSLNVQSYELLDNEADAAAAPAAEAKEVSTETETAAASASPAASASTATAAAPANNASRTKQSLISVNQAKLDQLMDLVGELVTTESMVVNNPDLRGLHLDNFSKSARELRKLTDELQDVVMSMRMVPLSGVFQKMNRIVRDMCKKLDKEVDLITEGGETEVDKTINEAIADPFMHMVRNSMDHAIESPEERLAMGKPERGQLALRAKNIGGEIVITISDDGRGLNTESILKKARNTGVLTKPESEYSEKEIFNLIMLPGFSTNTEVTEYSGRGVGMDVVRKNIEKVGGTISIDSKAGQGTTFTIKIPLTLAIMDGMELAVGNSVFTMPITSIKQSFKLPQGAAAGSGY